MLPIRILTEDELQRLVPLDDGAVACIEGGFRLLAEGCVTMPPVLSMAMEDANGEVDVKTAHLPGLRSFAVKISPGFFDNPARGLPSTSGLMVLLSAETGATEAVLLDNGYLTDIRTAAAGAVAAKWLSRPDARRAAILGAGRQARLQLRALTLVRGLDSAVIWARRSERAEAAAAEMTEALGIPVGAVAEARDAVAGADIVVTATPARSPILMADWLREGQHVTAMGSDQTDKAELDPHCLARADIYVPDRLSQSRDLGELRAALAVAAIPADEGPELGDIVAGTAPGRTSDSQITIADLTGTGMQDTAIACLARDRAEADGAGQTVDA